jgi:hypothetical protein
VSLYRAAVNYDISEVKYREGVGRYLTVFTTSNFALTKIFNVVSPCQNEMNSARFGEISKADQQWIFLSLSY